MMFPQAMRWPARIQRRLLLVAGVAGALSAGCPGSGSMAPPEVPPESAPASRCPHDATRNCRGFTIGIEPGLITPEDLLEWPSWLPRPTFLGASFGRKCSIGVAHIQDELKAKDPTGTKLLAALSRTVRQEMTGDLFSVSGEPERHDAFQYTITTRGRDAMELVARIGAAGDSVTIDFVWVVPDSVPEAKVGVVNV